MRAALAHEQHQPVVLSGDEAMGAAKLPRGVYDRGRHSNLRLKVTTLAKLIIGNAGNGRAGVADRKDAVLCAATLAPLTVLSSHHRMGFRPRSGADTRGNRVACRAARSNREPV